MKNIIQPADIKRLKSLSNLTTSSLRHLSVDQALADVVQFIAHLKDRYQQHHNQSSPAATAAAVKVIVAGSGYGGSLATWFRQRYPHLCAGAWASSAPIRAQLNHLEYKREAGAVLRRLAGNDDCYARLQSGFEELEQTARSNRLAELNAMMSVCKERPIVNDTDKGMLFYRLSEHFSNIGVK